MMMIIVSYLLPLILCGSNPFGFQFSGFGGILIISLSCEPLSFSLAGTAF